MTNRYLRRDILLVAASTFMTLTVGVSVCYGTTMPPVLSAPANSETYSNVSVFYSLPEAAATNTVQLTFDSTNDANDRVLTLSNGASGSYSFIINPANVTSDPSSVTSAFPSADLPDDTYDVTLSYRNAMLDPPASTSVSGVTVDTVTAPPTLNSPADSSVLTSPFTIDYDLPEVALDGASPTLVFTPTHGGTALTLSLNDSLSGSVSWLFDTANSVDGTFVTGIDFTDPLPNDVYDLSLRYQDQLGNPVAMDNATNVTVTTESTTTVTEPESTDTTTTAPVTAAPTTTSPVTTAPTTTTTPTGSVPETPSNQPSTLSTKWRKNSKKRTVTALFKTPADAAKVAITASKKNTVRKGKCKKLSGKKKKFTSCRIKLKRGRWLLSVTATDTTGNTVAKATKKVKLR